MAEYKGPGLPTLESYMGYGKSYNAGFLMFSGSYSEGFLKYGDKTPIWQSFQLGIGLSSRELVPGMNATYNQSPFNYSRPLLKLSSTPR